MPEKLTPRAMRALLADLRLGEAEKAMLIAHADAWEKDHAALAEELAAVREKLELLQRDLAWWKANAIRRRRRAEERRTGRREEGSG